MDPFKPLQVPPLQQSDHSFTKHWIGLEPFRVTQRTQTTIWWNWPRSEYRLLTIFIWRPGDGMISRKKTLRDDIHTKSYLIRIYGKFNHVLNPRLLHLCTVSKPWGHCSIICMNGKEKFTIFMFLNCATFASLLCTTSIISARSRFGARVSSNS